MSDYIRLKVTSRTWMIKYYNQIKDLIYNYHRFSFKSSSKLLSKCLTILSVRKQNTIQERKIGHTCLIYLTFNLEVKARTCKPYLPKKINTTNNAYARSQ